MVERAGPKERCPVNVKFCSIMKLHFTNKEMKKFLTGLGYSFKKVSVFWETTRYHNQCDTHYDTATVAYKDDDLKDEMSLWLAKDNSIKEMFHKELKKKLL